MYSIPGSAIVENKVSSDAPIFILGVLPRSGTNLLFNLLLLNPDCGVPEPIWEDYLLESSGLLLEYVSTVYSWWKSADPPWDIDERWESQLLEHLGQGLLSFFKCRVGRKRLLTKTPSVVGLDNFFQIFPDAYLLILVRDGRDLVESAMRSFGWDRDVTTKNWAKAAKAVMAFDEANRGRALPYRIIRYEDLVLNLDSELRKILDFVNFDPATYDFDRARELPVIGSCTTRECSERVHWKPVTKSCDFNPTERSSSWSRPMHERFNWLAGQYLIEFGYEVKSFSGNRRTWTLYNKLVDCVQKYRPYQLVPSTVWNVVKKAGYQVFRLGGIDVRDGKKRDT
jgi:hypothetical protein